MPPKLHQKIEPALCPFCRFPIPRPQEISPPERPSLMPVGQCPQCGAVYAYDATGRNLGAAFVDALVFACNLDWDLAWSLLPDEDYRQEIVEGYHLEGHFVVPEGMWQGRRVKGALFFVRLNEDLQEIAREGLKKRFEGARPVKFSKGEKETLPPPIPLSKQEVERLIAEYRLEPIIAAAQQDKKVTRYLQRLLCAGEELTRLRAAEALGRTLACLLESQPAAAVAVFQGFFNHFGDSSASPWGCIDAIGETVARAPDTFARYLPRLFPLLEDPSLQEPVLRALSRVAEAKPELLRKITPRLLQFLQSPQPAVRGYAVRLAGMLGITEAIPQLEVLKQDEEKVCFYTRGGFLTYRVRDLAAEALLRLKNS
ncbi:DVU0298 family protein [Ammonifex thiophilus]|uniref:DVU0298 family protein n=1 Tax=Ammonifex thiophilus TaxID=444093 RepID=UPI00106AC551|nr:DVU0298 family protein [Ammonifex thiophilus]